MKQFETNEDYDDDYEDYVEGDDYEEEDDDDDES